MRYHSKSTALIAVCCTLVWVFAGSATAFGQRGGGGNGEKGNRSGGSSMRGGGGMSGGNARNGNPGGSMRGSRSGGGNQFGNSGSNGRGGMPSGNRGGVTQGERSPGNFQGRSSGGNRNRGTSDGDARGGWSGTTTHNGWSGGGRNTGSRDGSSWGGTWGGRHDSHDGHDGRNHGNRGGGYYGGKHYGNYGRYDSSFNQFYFGPSGIGYGYYDDGWGISIGLPLGGYYDSYHYGRPYYGGSYVQPLYTEYIAPIETVYPESTAPVPLVDAAAGVDAYQLQAEEAFRENRHEDAARLVNHALVENPENGKLHLLASQIMFALGDYPAASQAIHQAASLLDRSEWGYVVENYADYYRGDAYVVQMKALSKFIKENPDAEYAWFLRGYHYKYLGYDEDAQKQLLRALELESRDRLAGELLIMAGGELPIQPEPAPPTPLENSLPPSEDPANDR